MAVIVVSKWVGRVVCFDCDLILEFSKEDVKEKNNSEMGVIFETHYLIECPQCHREVSVTELLPSR